jgi:hypothetical protein
MPLESIYIYAAALCGSILGVCGSAIVTARKRDRVYTRGWNAGREFEATQQLRQTLENSRRP